MTGNGEHVDEKDQRFTIHYDAEQFQKEIADGYELCCFECMINFSPIHHRTNDWVGKATFIFRSRTEPENCYCSWVCYLIDGTRETHWTRNTLLKEIWDPENPTKPMFWAQCPTCFKPMLWKEQFMHLRVTACCARVMCRGPKCNKLATVCGNCGVTNCASTEKCNGVATCLCTGSDSCDWSLVNNR